MSRKPNFANLHGAMQAPVAALSPAHVPAISTPEQGRRDAARLVSREGRKDRWLL